ncbi:interactor of constitutive active ROPs 4-like [Dorcoceras hygrometricum]|uniref:Interactor of constitutive active ROPs 4-like n=1 Tax=Dorcoceras hygrometricum TaxID=472368 RepID=A0A2Z7AG69_9LAMI|nr:interactor of constitutive active ROPs 4-like [Dorcoceras hygrometricum]
MSSSSFTNAYLVDFESVLNIPDNEGMPNMFKALESSGLHGFLGCKSVLYEPELEQFFNTALIQGGDITGAISGNYFSISPSRFAGVFEFPTEGLSDFSDVPKNLVYDARKIFSKLTGVRYCLEFWKNGGQNSEEGKGVRSPNLYLLNSDPALTMGEATPFPSSKILSPKTVLTYITTNQTVDTRGQSDEGGKTPVATVKRASKSKKKSESSSDATVEIVSEVEEQLYFVQSPESPPATSPCLETSTSSTSMSMDFDADDIPLDDTADILTSLPVGRTKFVDAIDDLRTLLIQRINDSNSEILSKLNTVDRGVLDALRHQHETLRHSLQGIRQDNQRQGDSQLLHIDHFKKGVAAHGLNVIENFVDVKKELSAQDAKITALDGQIAAIRSEQLEFQAKIAADLLSLSTQLGDIVDYIRGGDAKKGEGSSSRRPLPTPVNQGESSGNVVRTAEISQRDIDNAQRDIVERMMTADRETKRY